MSIDVVEVVIWREDRKSGSAGMPRPISYAVFCLKKKIGALRDRLADDLRGGDVAAVLQLRAADVGDVAADHRQRLAGGVVDDLGVNVLAAAVDAEPRALGGAEQAVVAGAVLQPHEPNRFVLVLVRHDRLPLILFFFFNDTATTEIYTLSLHDALPISTLERRPRGSWTGSSGSAVPPGSGRRA